MHPTREDIWGLVINEALAAGLPVITTNRCGAGLELIKNNENGFLVNVEDIDELYEKILNNVPKQNKKYVQKQLDQLDKNFMDYLCYWNEKYYRNGFVDGSQLVMGCLD